MGGGRKDKCYDGRWEVVEKINAEGRWEAVEKRNAMREDVRW